jgi:superfamily II DNA or RNA helicase
VPGAGGALISHTCNASRQLRLSSYDRLFPNQDAMPKGGFGNLIALPLQKEPRQRGCSVFVDDDLQPYPDQWAYLASLQRFSVTGLQTVIQTATGGAHPLDLTFIDEEDLATPWKAPPPIPKLSGPLPASITLTLADRLYLERSGLPQPLLNRLIRLAAFANPAFYKAQAMRLSVWDKPRVIGCAENFPQHIALPRGCLQPVQTLMQEQGIGWELVDERQKGSPLELVFAGQLRDDQEAAVEAILRHDIGVLQAPTAFGKTVVAAAILARRGVNTLVLVHRAELLRQWHERLQAFLDVVPEAIGSIGGGKAKPTGQLDIAVMQSLVRKGEVNPMVHSYGQVIVDECHHIAAASFEAILRQVKARYVLGLSATLVRRDGLQPILFMQCGPIRHTAERPAGAPQTLELVSRTYQLEGLPTDLPIQELMRRLAEDQRRTDRIVAEALACWGKDRKLLLLSERTDHITAISAALAEQVPNLFLLHGRQSAPHRAGHRATRGRRLRPPAARHPAAGNARVLEGHPSAVRRPSAPAALRQDQRAHHRLARPRPSCAATHVGASAAGISGNGVFPDFRSVAHAELQCRHQAQDGGGLLHPPIEAGQLGAAAVQRHRQVQRIAGPQAEGRILEQFGCLAKAAAVERAQFNTALQQSLELFPGGLAGLGAETVVALLDAQGAVGLGDQPVAADQGLAALFKPVEGVRTALFRGQQSHHHTRVEIDHQADGLTSAHRRGIRQSPRG